MRERRRGSALRQIGERAWQRAWEGYHGLVLWSLSVASHRRAPIWIGVLSFLEGIVFPIPPDIFLTAGGIASRARVFRLAVLITLCSVAGGVCGYWLGAALLESGGGAFLDFFSLREDFDKTTAALSNKAQFWTIVLFGFTVLPFKVIAWASGFASVPLPLFVVAALASRGTRFFLLALMLWLFGERIRVWLTSRAAFALSLLCGLAAALLVVYFLVYG